MTDQSQRDKQRQPEEQYEERGGEAACWAHLVCPDCGAMESEGHRPGCPADAPRNPSRHTSTEPRSGSSFGGHGT